MESMTVNLGQNSYDISFHKDFSYFAEVLEKINAPNKILVVTDTNVLGLYEDEVCRILKDAGYDAASYAFANGEENKNIDSVMGICAACREHKMDRASMIIALGGGVVGDMAGFAASIYMRGIRFVQVPTTLLSQSDSSVGGKTGCDFCNVKNLIGTFYQPKHVYINVSTLKTLPKKEFISGMAEVIKHSIIRDEEFFVWLKENATKIKAFDEETLIKMCRKNCLIKSEVVEKDEKEQGIRAYLNFGHTIGHAIESAAGFSLTHGECVALGIAAVSYIANTRGVLQDSELEEIMDVLSIYGFNTRIDLPETELIMSLMKSDKKSLSGRLKFVLPKNIGEVYVTTDVSEDEILDSLEFIRK